MIFINTNHSIFSNKVIKYISSNANFRGIFISNLPTNLLRPNMVTEKTQIQNEVAIAT